jgi:hypothetical protein
MAAGTAFSEGTVTPLSTDPVGSPLGVSVEVLFQNAATAAGDDA